MTRQSPAKRTSTLRAVPDLLRSPLHRVLTAALAAVAAGANLAGAQSVAGIGDDAIPLPRGGYRFVLGGMWNDYRAVFTPGGASGKRDLLSELTTDNLGVNLLPQLGAAQTGLRQLTGNSSFVLSLGTLEAAGEVRQSIAPISVDYGITKRVSVRLLVPYVESRDVSQLVLNRTGGSANVGRNPALVGDGAAARAANGALLTQIESARSALSAELSRCESVSATGCEVIRANPAGAQALLSRAQQTRSNLLAVYGGSTGSGAPVVPTLGSSLHTAVVATIGALRSDFNAYGITSITEAARPAAATTVLGPGSIGTVAGDTSFGVGYQRLGDTRRAGIGDVDLTATVLLFDTFKGDQLRRLLAPARGVRSNVTVGWRFGTAGADRTEDAFDVPIGEGANALLVRSTTDLLLNKSAWMSATVRAIMPMADRMAVVVPFRDEASTFASPVGVADAQRTLGNRLEVELAPRVAVGQFFGLSAAYLVRHWGADVIDATDPTSITLRAQRAEVPARTLSAAAFGVTFSTLASYARGRSRFPAEVMYTHTMPLSASGAMLPAVSSDRLELRIYTGFPRR